MGYRLQAGGFEAGQAECLAQFALAAHSGLPAQCSALMQPSRAQAARRAARHQSDADQTAAQAQRELLLLGEALGGLAGSRTPPTAARRPCVSPARAMPLSLIVAPCSAAADKLPASRSSRPLARNKPLAPVTATRTPCGPLLTKTPTSETRCRLLELLPARLLRNREADRGDDFALLRRSGVDAHEEVVGSRCRQRCQRGCSTSASSWVESRRCPGPTRCRSTRPARVRPGESGSRRVADTQCGPARP